MPSLDLGTVVASAVLVMLGVLIGSQVRGRRKRYERQKPTYTQMDSASAVAATIEQVRISSPQKRTRTSSPNALTARESEVAGLAASGLSNKEIAEKTGLSVFTVQNYLKAAYKKLKVRSRIELSRRLQHMGDTDD